MINNNTAYRTVQCLARRDPQSSLDGDKQDVMAEYDDKGDGDERNMNDNGVRYGLTELLVKVK